MKLKHIISLLYYVIRANMNPSNLKFALRGGEILQETGLVKNSIDRIKESPEGVKFFKERKIKDLKDPVYYSLFPKGSFGRHYYDHINSENIDPRDFGQMKVTNDETYLEDSIRKTHDILHAATGFDTSVAGELGIQGILARQFSWPFALLAVGAGSLISMFREPNSLDLVFENIAKGWNMGAELKNLILIDWDELWELPLEDVKREISLHRPHRARVSHNAQSASELAGI